MSKTILPSTSLSEFDRQYLLDRGKNLDDYLLTSDDFVDDEDIPPYPDWNVAALENEIEERNKDRDEDDKIVPESGRKKDLIAALEADDATAPDDDDEDEA